MTTLPLPGHTSTYRNSALGVVSDERCVMFAEVGPSGTATPQTLIKIQSEAQGRGLLGSSQGSEAIGVWFSSALQTLRETVELYVYTLDAAGWTANTWTTTHAGTTTAGGINVWRFGPHVVLVSQAKGADATAQRDAFVFAINDADIPLTAVAGVGAGETTLTSVHLGVAAGRTPLTVNLYPQLAETGVPGATEPAILNNADATGVPAVLVQADIDKIRTVTNQYWLGNVAVSAWLDSIDAGLQPGWDQINNYTWYLSSYVTPDISTFVALTGSRNDKHMSVFAQENAPHYELDTAVRLLGTIIQERADFGFANPPLVEVPIIGMQPGTLLFEPSGPATGPINDAGGMSHYSASGAAICPVFRALRDENDLGATDLTETTGSAILARRRILEAVGDILRARVGDLSRPDGVNLGKRNISAQALRDLVSTQLQQLASDGQIFATQEDAANLVESVVAIVTANIITGFDVTYNGQVTQPTLRHEATLQAT